jgi:hypothetical protein
LQHPGRRPKNRGGPGRPSTIARRQFRDSGGDGLGLALILLQALALGDQVIFLIGSRREGPEFGHGVTQPLLVPPGGLDRGASRVKLESRLAPRSPGIGHYVPASNWNAEYIQKHRVTGGISKAHLLVLTLNFDQQSANAAQKGDPRWLIVDEGARAAILRDNPAQYDLVLAFKPLLCQQGQRRMVD